jgi:hypothetical protein
MEKTEFFRLWGARDNLDMHVFDYWSDKREDQHLPWDCEDLDFNYSINYQDKTITIQTKHGLETYPLTDFYEKPKEEEPQMLWHCGYYDGPLSGIARYKEQIVWFECDNYEDELTRTRTYNLHALTQTQIDEEIYRHNRWRKQGGTHCDYCDDFWDPDAPELKKVSTLLQDFYDWIKQNPREKLTDGKILGTFDDVQFQKERVRKW